MKKIKILNKLFKFKYKKEKINLKNKKQKYKHYNKDFNQDLFLQNKLNKKVLYILFNYNLQINNFKNIIYNKN